MNYYIYYWKDIDYIHGDRVPKTKEEFNKDYAFVGNMHFPMHEENHLEEIYMHYNRDDNPLSTLEGQEKIKSLNVNHTSMSVGDIIECAKGTYIVDVTGFKKIRIT